jgi:hypothetical protein
MAQNDYQTFGDSGTDGVNKLSLTNYTADNDRVYGNGYTTKLLRSQLVNKVLQQTSKISSAVAQFLVNNGISALDTDSVATIAQNLHNVIQAGGRRNYIINGNFDKWDYATSQTVAGYGSDNRWQNNNSGSTETHSQATCTDTERVLFNAMYFSRTAVSSVAGVNNYVSKLQTIENINLLAGKTVTLSFWAKADANKNIAIEFWQRFGTGGSPSASTTNNSQLVALTTTWQKKTITVTIPSIIGKTLGTDGVQTTSSGLTFWFDAGSNNNYRTANLGQQSGIFDIAQVKIEDGSVATNGWYPYDGEFGGEIEACTRYYYRIKAILGRSSPYDNEASGATGVTTNGQAGGFRLTDQHPVEMRATPSVSYSGTINLWNGSTQQAVTSIIYNNSTKYARSIDWNVGSNFTATSTCIEFITQGAYLEVSSEL